MPPMDAVAGTVEYSTAIHLRVTADGPFACALEPGWESPCYGEVRPVPVLVARVRSRITTLTTVIDLVTQS